MFNQSFTETVINANAAKVLLITKITFGMLELTDPYSNMVVRMVVMESVTRAGTAERPIQKQHQLRITNTTAGM